MSVGDVLKIIILGGGRVGKTSILSKYFNNKFDIGEKSTINPAFYEKTTKYKGKNVHLRFWDTASQDQFYPISHICYQNAVGALLVYDVKNFETFDKVENWVRALKEDGEGIEIIILGNKFDLSDKNELEKNSAEVNAYCAKENCKHFYTSAKTGYNLEDAFESLINSVLIKVNSSWEGLSAKRRRKRIEISEQKMEKEKKKCY